MPQNVSNQTGVLCIEMSRVVRTVRHWALYSYVHTWEHCSVTLTSTHHFLSQQHVLFFQTVLSNCIKTHSLTTRQLQALMQVCPVQDCHLETTLVLPHHPAPTQQLPYARGESLYQGSRPQNSAQEATKPLASPRSLPHLCHA